ncbi:zinc ABC transporter substrate-binding protein [Pseudanabaena sp. FACHB-1998]|uniref:metal ABC transporter solute-binding protein, Zn/Mn family n=1 Tax=Pseudanabaena sp. FACHB-1998 TaxID=2692858 RepID=UPI00168117CD|nr:zinc ABC transporter substrate-binding protein [Pseudanabaena sp. FACHB-1998]MBD2177511.1 zinc ABC transporter substrate-binding protein [Pseudanabaena sp. FACHB-1998]
MLSQSSPPIAVRLHTNKKLKITAIAPVFMAIATTINACSLTNTPINTPQQPPNRSIVTTNKAENLPLVVATNSVSCGLAQQIAGDTINLQCLIEAGTDPHVYQPKPDDRKAIDSAKLILYGGYAFEPNLIKLIQSSSNPAPKLAVSEVAVPSPLIFEEGHSHNQGEGKKEAKDNKAPKEADPHVWNNAKNGIKIAQAISQSLSNLRPDQAKIYVQNTTNLVNELEQLDTWIMEQIATIPETSRKLVTTHDALGYYAQAYGIPVEGALNGISTDEQPTPARVKEIVAIIQSSKVPTIFAEVSINPKLINTVAKEANVKVSDRQLYADGLGAKGSEAETYAGMLIANTRTIVEGLGGKYSPFQLKKP